MHYVTMSKMFTTNVKVRTGNHSNIYPVSVMLDGKNPFKPIAMVVATKVCKHLIDIINTSLEPFAVYWFEIQCHPLSNMTTPHEHTSY